MSEKNIIKISLETEDGILERKYGYDQSPLEINWQDVAEDMLDSLANAYEIEADLALNHDRV